MKKQKGFIQLSKSWYGDSCLSKSDNDDEITIGLFSPDGSNSITFLIIWEMLGRESVPCLQAFNDSWHLLSEMSELLSVMSKLGESLISPDGFADILRGLKFKDFTKNQNQNENGFVSASIKKEINEAYQFLRHNNNTISSSTLDLIKVASLEYVDKNAGETK